MSTLEIQQQRQAEAIRDAAELVQATRPDAVRLSTAMAELLIADDGKLAALVYELAEMTSRLDRTVDHLGDHVLAAQEKEIEALKGRVAELESREAAAEARSEAAKKRS